MLADRLRHLYRFASPHPSFKMIKQATLHHSFGDVRNEVQHLARPMLLQLSAGRWECLTVAAEVFFIPFCQRCCACEASACLRGCYRDRVPTAVARRDG